MTAARLAVIADTHGLLREAVVHALQGVTTILHAGDVGKPAIFDALAGLGTLHAVRGNVDRGVWADALPEECRLTWQGRSIYMVHRAEDVRLDDSQPSPDLIVVGHSHKPLVSRVNGIACLNPGSIGPRRFSLPISMAWVSLSASATPDGQAELPAEESDLAARATLPGTDSASQSIDGWDVEFVTFPG